MTPAEDHVREAIRFGHKIADDVLRQRESALHRSMLLLDFQQWTGRTTVAFGDGVTRLEIPVETYHDMGDPSTLTVTIEPGDRLNN